MSNQSNFKYITNLPAKSTKLIVEDRCINEPALFLNNCLNFNSTIV
jgi:hypothetical protein